MDKVLLYINGQPPAVFPDPAGYQHIFCTDGAYNYLRKNRIVPQTITGDFDSYPASEIPSDIEVVATPDQNFTDFEKALRLIFERGYKAVDVYGSSGKAHDHFLGNLSSAARYQQKLKIHFFDNFSHYFFAGKHTGLNGNRGKIISLYPFPIARKITTYGLRYPLNQEDLEITTRVGTRNTADADEAGLSFESGNLLVFISR